MVKILLTNHNLETLGGSETWTTTMYNELMRLGNEVHVFTGSGNYNLLPDAHRLDDNYDLALINHNICVTALEGINIKTRVFTSHGIIPELEQPIKGADYYVAVSEEVQAHLKELGFESDIIRNPIDTERFNASPVHEKLENILFMSNYQGDALKVIVDASNGYQLRVSGREKQMDAREAMEWADLVIGLGRTALESMSMGRNTIVYDYGGFDGYVTPETMLEYRKHNCSGRRYGLKIDADTLKQAFECYDPKNNMRDYILKNNDVRKIAKQYLSYLKN